MSVILENVASCLWIVLAIIMFFGIKKWNKRFSELYDELQKDIKEVMSDD